MTLPPMLRVYCDMMMSIKQGNGVKGKSNAKHLYLLSIIDCIAMGTLTENRLMLDDPHIVQAYKGLARYYNENYTPIIFPYYHSKSADFYHLVWKEGDRPDIKGPRPTPGYLREHLACARLDDGLWELLQVAEHRDYIKRNIINRYLINT